MSASARARECRSERKSVFPQDAYGELIRRGRGGGISAGTAQGKTSVCVRARARGLFLPPLPDPGFLP